jgi:predicted esterase
VTSAAPRIAFVVALAAGCREGHAPTSAVAPRAGEARGQGASATSEHATSARVTNEAIDAAPVFSEPIASDAAPSPQVVRTDWCIDGLDALDDESCYVLPRGEGGERKLLIYLHGIVPPQAMSDPKRNVETVVANAARRAGYAALLPRGRRGIGPAFAKDWWAWPTTASDYAKYAPAMIAGFEARRAALARIAGGPFARTYLAGSSNGAYFVTAIALRGAMDVDGFGAMSGGSGGATRVTALAAIAPRPFYVGIPTNDETTTAGAKALAALLASAKWPRKIAEHPFGHGARETYLDEAFAFWDEEAAREAARAAARDVTARPPPN